jgi:hypothetical protein
VGGVKSGRTPNDDRLDSMNPKNSEYKGEKDEPEEE